MKAKKSHPKPRSREIVLRPAAHRLDAAGPRDAGEVLAVLRSAAPAREGRVPIGLWKTGWLAQPEGA